MKRRDLLATIVVALIGVPVAYAFSHAAVDGVHRAQASTYTALFGADVYEGLEQGQKSEQHYLGRDRLAPDFELPDKDGRMFRLSAHRGKVVVLNFWSITCAPCVKEMPSLIELARIAKHRDDLEVVAISTDRDWSEVSTIFPNNPEVRVLFDSTKEIVEGKYGTRLFPETWVIDREGVIRLRYDGAFDWSSALALDVIMTAAR